METFPKLIIDLQRMKSHWKQKDGMDYVWEEDANGRPYLVVFKDGKRACIYKRSKRGNWTRKRAR